GDYAAARDEARRLDQADAKGGLGLPVLLAVDRWATEKHRVEEGRTLSLELLGKNLEPAARAYVVLLGAELEREAKQPSEARSGFELVASNPSTPALGWTQFRRGRPEEARKLWTQFATSQAKDPRAPAALLLASEIAARSGDTAGAQALLDGLIQRYPEGEHAEVARLNRAILLLRAGKGAGTVGDLTTLVRRAPLSPYIGRMRLARAAALMADGKPEEATRELTAALAQGEGAVAHPGP